MNIRGDSERFEARSPILNADGSVRIGGRGAWFNLNGVELLLNGMFAHYALDSLGVAQSGLGWLNQTICGVTSTRQVSRPSKGLVASTRFVE